MRRLGLLFTTLALLAGCSPAGYIAKPTVPPGESATLTIVRPAAFTGGGGTVIVRVNGTDTLRIGSGQHATFSIPAGPVAVTSPCLGWFANRPEGVEFTAAPRQRYFVAIGFRTPSWACYIEGPLEEDEGRALMGGTRAVR